MRVALIVVYYPPHRSSAAVQMRDLAREFLAQGHEPIVLVPDEHLDQPWTTEMRDGLRVVRLRAFATRDIGYLRRTINEFLMPWTMLRALRKSPFRETRWDAVVWYSPSMFFGPLVNALKKRSGCRSYLILRDIFPDWAVDLGLMRRGIAYRLLKLVERQQHAAADVIGIQAPSNSVYLDHVAANPKQRLEVLWNWLSPAAAAHCSIDIASTPLRGRRIFVYAGNMGVAQGLDVFMDLVERLEARRDLGFLFVGRGSELPRLRKEAAARKLTNVLFFDEVDPDEIPGLLAQCHVGLLALDPRHRTHNVPGKFLAYMRAGLPVLARINANNDLVALIEEAGVGRVDLGESLESLEQLAESMAADTEALSQMSARSHVLADRLFSPTAAVRQIVASLDANV
jgi:glycosyltransferase involved in cell wall biosynthesis